MGEVGMNIAVVGAGYVGLVTGVCLSELGHLVQLVNRNPEKAAAINAGTSPIYEPGLDELLRKNIGQNLTASTDYRWVGCLLYTSDAADE